ncbi:MAG: hypothetical protein EXS64_04065 [Candidatus Latescibacteria bacterium]|nr:hypothetical protein [Candidatus Latescibacterota bacterium]
MSRLLLCLLMLFSVAAHAQADLLLPTEIRASDTPDDTGGSLTLTWRKTATEGPGIRYLVSVAESPQGPYYPAAEVSSISGFMTDAPAEFGHRTSNADYHYAHVETYKVPADSGKSQTRAVEKGRVYHLKLAVTDGQRTVEAPAPIIASAHANWFNWAKLNNFIIGTVFSVLILAFIAIARRNPNLYIRKIAGLDAIDEALGRATEMGKPVLFIHGLQGMDSISTIAATNILGRVARRTAAYDTQLRVATNDPIVMAVSQEVVKEGYLDAGRPDAYNPDHVFMAAADQFSYAAALEGMMTRERPATNILMGYFYAEALLLSETGASIGAIQIAGTDSYTQLPFFVTTCDYTLMGEELYAASAYLSREPKLLGSLKGQDVGKAFLILVLVLGTLLATFGYDQITYMFTSY